MPFLNFHLPAEKRAGIRRPQRHARAESDASEPEKTCPNCHREIPISTLWSNHNTCSCGYHFRMSARQRLHELADKRAASTELFSVDRIRRSRSHFPNYAAKLETVRASSREPEAVVCGTALIGGSRCCLFVMDPYFMMGSMGAAVGEKITQLFEFALQEQLPVFGVTVSGGARMQEGLISLMQMAKTSAAVKRHSDAGLFYLALLTDPTMGGVTASFAMEADIILAEPGACIGFAGARVVEQTTKKLLPKGFQKAESMLAHGFVDSIVPRAEQKQVIAQLLQLHCTGGSHADLSL